jgi:hypothetical protein
MLEGLLSPQVVRRARDETLRRVIRSYRRFAGLWKWELLDNNWCAVCAGSIGGAAMYLVEDDRLLAGLLQRLAPPLRRFIAGFSGDGVCMEGLSYWTYGLSFYTAFGDLLLYRTGGTIDIFKDPAFVRIAAFQQACYFPGGGTLNFSDASGGDMFRLGLSCYLAEHIPAVEVPRLPYQRELFDAPETSQMAGKALVDPCGRFAPALRDLVWASGDVPLTKESIRESIFPQAQWLLCAGEGGTGFAAKGGHNDESHNHNDVGNFIFYKNGKMILCDLGAGEYTKDYFSDKRYTIFCTQSESHNLPLIDGRGQKAGREFGARDCVISPGGNMILDIAGAYGLNGLEKLERRFSFNASGGILLLEDAFVFSGSPLPVLERFVSSYPPKVEAGVVYIDTGKDRCCLRGPESAPVIQKLTYRDHNAEDAVVFTIDFPFEPKESVLSAVFTIG